MRNFLKMQKGSRRQSGFTLIETVVAISILMLGVLGPMALAQRNVKASREASDRLVASFLAQEGIEVVRNVIANNSADGNVWTNGVPLAQDVIVDVTPVNPTLMLQACVGCSAVVYQNTNKFYWQQNPAPVAPFVPTKFSRLVRVTNVEPNKRLTMTATVTWGAQSVVLSEDIYNWFFQLN